MQKFKTALANLAVQMLYSISRILPARTIQTFLLLFRHTFLRGLLFNIWSRVLTYSGYRNLRAEWSYAFWKRRTFFGKPMRDPIYGIQHALDLMAIGHVDIGEVVDQLKSDIYEESGDLGETLRERITLVGVINEIERRKFIGERHYLLVGSKLARVYFQQRMERAHAMRLESNVALYARCYLATVRFEPTIVIRICEKILTPNGLHDVALEFLELSTSRLLGQELKLAKPDLGLLQNLNQEGLQPRSRRDHLQSLAVALELDNEERETRAAINRQRIEHLLELGRLSEVNELLEAHEGEEGFRSVTAKLRYLRDDEHGSKDLLKTIIHSTSNNQERASRLGDLAEQLEEARDFDGALSVYRAAYRANQRSGLNISQAATWRYLHALLTGGHWSEAVAVMRSAQIYMWRFFLRLNKRSARLLAHRDYRLPEDGGLILGCWGIGDEFFRIGLWNQLANKSAKWAFTCEPRLESVLKRSLPDAEIIVNSRTMGPHAVTEMSYWADREGLPNTTDLARLTLPVLNAIKRYKNLLISETLFYEFIRRRCEVEEPVTKPLLTLDPQEMTRVENWLSSLPDGLNVAISWRSGKRSASRDKSYTSLMDWEQILSIPGINFINIQYSDSEEEKQEARDAFGANIVDMPDVNRKHDIETLLAICASCDVVIAPCTAVREMAGASGATTWSLSTTPFLPDLWRIQDGTDRDKIFPSMRHFTAMEYGDSAGVLAAMGRELERMQTACAATIPGMKPSIVPPTAGAVGTKIVAGK